MAVLTSFQASTVKPAEPKYDETITISTHGLFDANQQFDDGIDWDPDTNKIEEIQTPETFDDIYYNLDLVTDALNQTGDDGECFESIVEALDTFKGYVQEAETMEVLNDDYFKDAFESIVSSFSDENPFARSEGINSFHVFWESKKFLWFSVKLPVGFEIKLSASTCREVISRGIEFGMDAIIDILIAHNFGIALAATISLLAGLTGNVILISAVSVIATLAADKVVSFVVGHLLSWVFSDLVNWILSYNIKNGIIVRTVGTTPISFSFQ